MSLLIGSVYYVSEIAFGVQVNLAGQFNVFNRVTVEVAWNGKIISPLTQVWYQAPSCLVIKFRRWVLYEDVAASRGFAGNRGGGGGRARRG